MDTGTRHRPRRRQWRLVLVAVKALVLGCLLALVVVGGTRTAGPGSSGTESAHEAYRRVVERAVLDHDCSYQGYGAERTAASALIRTAQGDVRVVSFQKAWDVYNGKRPGRLIAVCLDDRATAMDRLLKVRQRVKG